MFKKKKEEQKQADRNQLERAMATLQQKQALAEGIRDPSERLYALKTLNAEIDTIIEGRNREIRLRSHKKSTKVFFGTNVGCIAVSASLAIPTGGLSVFLLFPGLMGSVMGAVYSEGKESVRQKENTSDLIEIFERQKESIDKIAKQLLEEQFSAIAISPKCPDILIKFPDLKEQFSALATRKAMEGKIQPTSSEKAPKPPGFEF